MSRRNSLRRRVLAWFTGSGAILILVVGASAWWLHDAGHQIEISLAREQEAEARVSRFQSSVLRELEAGHRYLVTKDPEHLREYQLRGIQTYRLQQEILAASEGSPRVAEALAPIQTHLAIAEASISRAHRLAELGREQEAQASLNRTTSHTDAILAGLEEMEVAKARERREAARRLTGAARFRGFLALLFITGGFGVAFVVSRRTVRDVVNATTRLRTHADRLQEGDLEVRTDVEELPEELRTLGEGLNEASRSLAELKEKEEALRRAEKLSAVGLLVSGVAHELNNPLATVLLSSEELLQNDDPEALTEGLQTIRDQAYRARSIVRKLLATVREDADSEGSVTLDELRERVEPNLRRQAEECGVELHWILDPELPPLQGEEAGLDTVLTSLVSNAIEAAGEGGRVKIRGTHGRGEAILEVTDDGPGIGPEIRSRIFDPFFTTKTAGEKVGLGLSTALGIVRSLGGAIEHTNLPAHAGGGARFTVTLPTGERASERGGDEGGEHAGKLEPSPASCDSDGRRIRILIVDDEEPIRRTLRRVFQRQDWDVDGASDGQEALEKIQAARSDRPYDVILSDLKMPVMSGMELVDRLTTDHPEIASRFVIMTGDNVAPGPADFLARTSLPTVDKPFELSELVGILKTVAREAPRPDPGRSSQAL